MSWEEKRVWVYLVTSLATAGGYAAVVCARASGDLTAVAYGWPLVWAIGGSIVLNVVLSVIAAMIDPAQADRSDERDVAIGNRGDLMGSHATAVAMLGVLAGVIAGWAHFWIGNGIYAAFLVGVVVSSAVKLHGYRRGY